MTGVSYVVTPHAVDPIGGTVVRRNVDGSIPGAVAYFPLGSVMRLNTYHTSAIVGAAGAAPSAGPNPASIWATPFGMQHGRTVSALCIYVASAAAGQTCRIGLYANNSLTDPFPTTALARSGDLDIASTGLKELTGLAVVCPPGLYWLAMQSSGGAPGYNGIDPEDMPNILGGWSSSNMSYGAVIVRNANTYGAALPAVFPVGALGYDANTTSPAIGIKFSA